MSTESPELPSGYTADVLPRVGREQILVLYYPDFARERESQFMVDRYEFTDAQYAAKGVQAAYISVQSSHGETVGVGCLRHNQAEGELSDLTVLPQYRSLGVGRWIINERIKIARELALQRLYVGQMATSNTLKYYYESIGFKRSSDGRASPAVALGLQTKLAPQFVYDLFNG